MTTIASTRIAVLGTFSIGYGPQLDSTLLEGLITTVNKLYHAKLFLWVFRHIWDILIMAENPTIPLIKTHEGAIMKLTGDGLTGPNWVTWRVRMWSLLALCKVEAYVHGEILQPARDVDPVGHDNWKKNNNYAKHLITQNVADEPLVHIQHGLSSHTAWHNLEAIYEDKSQETAIAIIWNLWHTTAEEEDDIGEHLTTLKKYWEHLNLVNDINFWIPKVQFKIAIISSLPTSWDNFQYFLFLHRFCRNLGILTESAGIDRNSGIPAESVGIHRNSPESTGICTDLL